MTTPRTTRFALGLAALTCVGGCRTTEVTPPTGQDADADADADSDADSDAPGTDTDAPGPDTGTPVCSTPTPGQWVAVGSDPACFLTVDSARLAMTGPCRFSLSAWTPEPDGVPTGGTIRGDTVTLEGDGWTTCTGDLAPPGYALFTCAAQDCVFSFSLL